MPSHRINLRGPWDYCLLPEASRGAEQESCQGTIAMPQEWRSIFGEKSGTAQFRRKFHRPTNLEPHEQVMIILTEVRGSGTVQLNQQPVGHLNATGESVEFEISSIMNSFNELLVEVSFDPQHNEGLSGGIFGVVALEIRSK